MFKTYIRLLVLMLIFPFLKADAGCFLSLHKITYGIEKTAEIPLYSPSQFRTVVNGAKIMRRITGHRTRYIPLNSINGYHPIAGNSKLKTIIRIKELVEHRIHKHKQLSIPILNKFMPSVTNIRVIELAPNEFIPFDGSGRILVLKNVYMGRNPSVEVEVLTFKNNDMPLIRELIAQVLNSDNTRPVVAIAARKMVQPKVLASAAAVTIAGGSLAAYIFYRYGYYSYYESVYGEDVDAEIIAHDGIFSPGQEQYLNLEVRSIKLHNASKFEAGVTVAAKIEGKQVAQGSSDANGLLTLRFSEELPIGKHQIELIGTLDKYKYEGTAATVTVLDPNRPVAIVDIDKTLSADSGLKFVKKSNSENTPLPGSQEYLKQLNETHEIVYLTHRSNLFTAKTNRWLKQENYPAGSVIYSDYLDPDSDDFILYSGSAEYKIRVLEQFQQNHPHNPLDIGLGDKFKDAKAYGSVGIRSIQILDDDEERQEESFPKDTQFLKSWQEVVR
jgi:hypothetical protein